MRIANDALAELRVRLSPLDGFQVSFCVLTSKSRVASCEHYDSQIGQRVWVCTSEDDNYWETGIVCRISFGGNISRVRNVALSTLKK